MLSLIGRIAHRQAEYNRPKLKLVLLGIQLNNIWVSHGASSITANILEAAPVDFTAIYKLNDLSKYFK